MTGSIPGGDVEGHIEGHVRRLEALRRAGIVNRLDANHWLIPTDFLERAVAFDDRQGHKLIVELHSAVGLDGQVAAEAAAQLDRLLVGRHRVETARMGFGHQVQEGLEQRRQHLIAQGLAKRHDDGRISCRPDLLATLQRHELDRVGEYLAAKRTEGSIYVPARDGTLIRGTYCRSIMLASGKFAVIQRDEHFTLVPWRAILERFRRREFVGVVRRSGVSWQVGLQRDRGLSR